MQQTGCIRTAVREEMTTHNYYVCNSATMRHFKGLDLSESDGLLLPEQAWTRYPSLVHHACCQICQVSCQGYHPPVRCHSAQQSTHVEATDKQSRQAATCLQSLLACIIHTAISPEYQQHALAVMLMHSCIIAGR